MKLGCGLNIAKHDHSYMVVGGLFEFIYKDLMLNFEYATADGYRGTSNDITNQSAEGFYSTLAYYVHPKVQLIGRFDTFDPNKDISNNDIQEYTLGLNYYVFGTNMKFSVNYVYRNSEKSADSNRFFVQTQFVL